ncbi:hypothetical protein KEK_06827 [Mycolicibacterium thermoresistibile ATCC 19527]|uniref:Uncharacterized protein n=1 Tax=Mycolicibacterium thermoresistibile (strain ATCC 19527 / DSM 44167 / CIP 105390 / JCM 6362 / NCTC 10409 / 316) TaxID=1078020 RepID=G7CEF1_MYCT3|nr:hypothetical protein KEK_06827 [Mycolicibacterium thermoresistibile ATCC 19527]
MDLLLGSSQILLSIRVGAPVSPFGRFDVRGELDFPRTSVGNHLRDLGSHFGHHFRHQLTHRVLAARHCRDRRRGDFRWVPMQCFLIDPEVGYSRHP